jgi:pentatricopeptide repeat protein
LEDLFSYRTIIRVVIT